MSSTTENKPFYNVMPEVTSGPVSKPKAAPQEVVKPASTPIASVTPPVINQSASQPTAAPITIPPDVSTKRSLKWLIFLGIGLALLIGLAVAIYFVFLKADEVPQMNLGNNIVEQPIETIPEVTTSAEWLLRYFNSETCIELVLCGDKADPDRDGLDNLAEYNAGTDPNNPDSDNDGLADGDEINIFNTDPLLTRTYRSGEYSDLDFARGGYDISTNEQYTPERLFDIKSRIKQYGLHQPTLSSLGATSFQLYEFTDPNQPTLPADLDLSPQAKLDRDSQRQSTIKKVGAALLKYNDDKKSFPPTDDFVVMADMIRSYNMVATNYNDPINIQPYKYGYQSLNNNADFSLSYYSETQNQLIRYSSQSARDDAAKENTQAFDDQRKLDLENIQRALLVWSTVQLDPASNKEFVFPPTENLKSELIPRYITALPTDPVTKQDYQYEVGPTFDTFTIRAALQNPAAGTTGYLCNQTECRNY